MDLGRVRGTTGSQCHQNTMYEYMTFSKNQYKHFLKRVLEKPSCAREASGKNKKTPLKCFLKLKKVRAHFASNDAR